MSGHITTGLMSSLTEMWGTPKSLFDKLDEEFHFDCDVCASDGMEMVKHHYNPQMDGLKQDWSKNKSNWMNPPYGRVIPDWMKKACESNANVVCLIPARTDTKWWHDYVMGKAVEVRFVAGRLKFNGEKNGSAPFPSAIVVYKAGIRDTITQMRAQERY